MDPSGLKRKGGLIPVTYGAPNVKIMVTNKMHVIFLLFHDKIQCMCTIQL